MNKYLLVLIVLILSFSIIDTANAANPEEDFGWDYKNGWFDKNPGKFSAPKEIYDNDLKTRRESGVNGSFEVKIFEPLKSGILGFYVRCDPTYTSYTMYNGNKAVYTNKACNQYVVAKISEPIDRIKFETSRNYSSFYVDEFELFDEVNYQTVKNLKVSKKTFNEINIEWENSGSNGTKIYLNNALVATLGKDDKSYKLGGLKANTKYEISVSSLYKDGESITNDVTTTTDKLPDLPNDFVNVSDISATSAVLKFNVDKLPILPRSIKLYRRIDATNPDTLPVSETHKITGLNAETEYTYYVNVDYGNGNVTNMVPVKFKTIEPNREVSDLKATSTEKDVNLKWNMPDYKTLDFARIYRKKDKDVGVMARMFSFFSSADTYEPLFETNGTTFKDLTVKADTEYQYKVTTVDKSGNETDGKTVVIKTKKISVGGGGVETDENGNYVITWTSPTEGKIKVLVGGVQYAIVPASDKKIVIPKDKMKFDLFGKPDVKLVPIDENGNEGEITNPGTGNGTGGTGGGGGIGEIIGGGEAADVINAENTLEGGVQLLGVIGLFVLLGLAFRVVPKLVRMIRNAFSDKSENTYGKRRVQE